jgi:hypothetical protein
MTCSVILIYASIIREREKITNKNEEKKVRFWLFFSSRYLINGGFKRTNKDSLIRIKFWHFHFILIFQDKIMTRYQCYVMFVS